MLREPTPTAFLAAFVLISAGAAAGCGSSSPTAPRPTQNRMDLMPAGQYRMFVTSALDSTQPCRLDPGRTPFVLALTQVTIAIEGDTWIGRPADPVDSDFELRVRAVRDDAVVGGRVVIVRVEGTLRGSLRPAQTAFPETIAFGPTTETRIEGTLTEGATTIATIRGEIVHTNPAGSVSCPTGALRLSRTAPPL